MKPAPANSSSNPLRLGLVGLGALGGNVIRCLDRIPAVELAAICDPDEEVLEQRRELRSVVGYTDFRELLAQERLDLLYIASPNHTHLAPALAAIERGLPLILQKPMAATLADCRTIMDAWRRQQSFLYVGFELRVSRMFQRIKEHIDGGAIGQVRDVSINYYTGLWPTWYQRPGAWKYRRATSGGMFPEKLCHSVDLIRFYSGSEFRDVTACGPSEPIIPYFEIADNCHALFRLRSGATGRLSFSFTRAAEIPFDPGPANYDPDDQAGHAYDVSVIGTSGSIFLNINRKFLTLVQHRTEHGQFKPQVAGVEDFSATGDNQALYHDNEGELRTIGECLQRGAPPPLDPEDAYRSMEATFYAQQSLESGRTVAFEEPALTAAPLDAVTRETP